MNLFSLFIALGAGLGLYQVYRNASAWTAGRRVDAAILVLLVSLIGARAGYALRYPVGGFSGFWRFWNGGLSLEGALVGALLALVIASAWMRFPFGRLADALSALILPLWVAGWLGCWQAGCGYGVLAGDNSWWALPVMDETGLVADRFPLQPLAAAVGLVTYLLAGRIPLRSSRSGIAASLSGLLLGLNLLAVSFLLADGRVFWYGLRPMTWAGSLIALFSLAGLVFARSRFSMLLPAWFEKRRLKVQH